MPVMKRGRPATPREGTLPTPMLFASLATAATLTVDPSDSSA